MLRKDYERFIKICNNYLKPGFFLQTNKTDPEFYRQYAKLRKDNTKYVEFLSRNKNFHQGIFIDIFPMDNVIPRSLLEKIRCRTLLFLWKPNRIRNIGVSPNSAFIKKVVGKILKFSNKIIKKSTYENIEKLLLTMFNYKCTGYVNHLTNRSTAERFRRFLIKEEDFLNIIEWEFEGHKFPIPQNYNGYLTNIYGDYMKLPPKELRKPHHDIINIEIN